MDLTSSHMPFFYLTKLAIHKKQNQEVVYNTDYAMYLP